MQTYDVFSLFQPSVDKVAVRLKQFGCIWVVDRDVEATKAAALEWRRPTQVCQDYQKGLCHAGENCQKIHIKPQAMQTIKNVLWSSLVLDCCLVHGDMASKGSHNHRILRRSAIEILGDPDAPRIFISPDLIAFTFHLCIMKDSPVEHPLTFRANRVCRLHQQGKCNWNFSCRNVHVCRELWKLRQTILDRHHRGQVVCKGLAYFVNLSPSKTLNVSSGAAMQFQALLPKLFRNGKQTPT